MAELNWNFGLIDAAGKYLTAENFGFALGATGSSLKTKQIFSLEQPAGSEKVFIRTALNRYIAGYADGSLKADSESRGANEEFTIEAQPDGKWALKTSHGFYVGGSGEKLSAFTKVLAADRLWIVQLAMHPQVWLRNVNRKTYVHIKKDATGKFQLTTDEVVPWGDDALITLHFSKENGTYSIQASNGQFLSADGQLKDSISADTQFIFEFQGGQVALKSNTGNYLTGLGAEGVLRATKKAITKDELFVLEDCHPQFKFTASNGRKVSVRGGVEVSANQDQATDAEFFQIEFDQKTKKWAVRTHKNLFWTTAGGSNIECTAAQKGATEYFELHWLGPKVAFKASNGSFVAIKPNGGLIANAASVSDTSSYTFEIINRPRLVLRGEHGFVDTLSLSNTIEANKASYEAYSLHVKAGVCEISGKNGKYWKVNPAQSTVTCDGDAPEPFFFEFVEHSKVLIKHGASGLYLKGAQNGGFTATGRDASASTLWEY